MFEKHGKSHGKMHEKVEKVKEHRKELKEGGHASFREHVAKLKKECHGGEAV